MTAERWAVMTPALDLLVLDSLLASFRGLVGVLGSEVLGAVLKAGLEPIEERLVVRPGGARSLDLVEPRLVGGRAGHGGLVAVELRAVPAGTSQDKRQGQALADEGDEDDRERQEQDEVPLGETLRERQRGGQRDRAAQTRPAHDEGEPRGEPRIASRDHLPRRPGQEAGREDPDQPGDDDDATDEGTRPRSSAGARPPSPSQ